MADAHGAARGHEYDADWVINTDADEFWMPRGTTLKELFAAIPEPYGVIFALSRHFAPLPEDDVTFVERMTVRVTPPVAINDPTSPYRPHLKVGHRADPSITISHGAHSASSDLWDALHHWHGCDVLTSRSGLRGSGNTRVFDGRAETASWANTSRPCSRARRVAAGSVTRHSPWGTTR